MEVFFDFFLDFFYFLSCGPPVYASFSPAPLPSVLYFRMDLGNEVPLNSFSVDNGGVR